MTGGGIGTPRQKFSPSGDFLFCSKRNVLFFEYPLPFYMYSKKDTFLFFYWRRGGDPEAAQARLHPYPSFRT